MWLLLSIVLVGWEFPEYSQFPMIVYDPTEAVKYASLWETRDIERISERKIFWVLIEMNIRMGINHKPWLSPTSTTVCRASWSSRQISTMSTSGCRRTPQRHGASYPIWLQMMSSFRSLSRGRRSGGLQLAPWWKQRCLSCTRRNKR